MQPSVFPRQFGALVFYAALFAVTLGWGYVLRGGGRAVMGLYDRGHGRFGAVIFFLILPALGLLFTVGIPLWLQMRERLGLAWAALAASLAILAGGMLMVFRNSGI